MGANFSCLGGTTEPIKNATDVKQRSPQEFEEEKDGLVVYPSETVQIQSAVRGFIARKELNKPLADLKESRNWFKVEEVYAAVDKPVSEFQHSSVTFLEKDLDEIHAVRPDDGVEVQSKPAMVLKNGSIYEGEWNKKGNHHGKGTLITEDGSKLTGIFKEGTLEGLGRIIHATGLLYEGEFKDGKLNGKGKIKAKHGGKFEGNLTDGKLNGYGVEEWPDGMKYEGEYHFGQRKGRGKLSLGDGSVYEGDFLDDKMHGKGEYRWKNGNKYTGEWKNNKMDGYGVFLWQDGRKYEGQFKDDVKSGDGKMTWPDGRIYEGEWLDGKQHGNGSYSFIKNNIPTTRKGVWENGSRKSWTEEKVS